MAKTTLSGLAEKGKAQIKKKLGLNDAVAAEKLKIGDYTVFLNPNQISHSFKVNYVKPETAAGAPPPPTTPANTTAPALNVASSEPESLTFDLLLDGTGATGMIVDVDSEIAAISKATYKKLVDKNEKKKEIEITWGRTVNGFKGFLETFDVTYSLFDKSGKPLRATVKLAFAGYSSLTDAPRRADNNTTEINVDMAQTITNMCKAVYTSPSAYIAVAKSNKLTNVRKLKPGTKLVFPPKKG